MRNISQAVISSIPIKLPGLRLQRQISSLVNTQLAGAVDARQAARTQAAEADALIDAVYRQAFENIVPVAVPPEFEDAPTGRRWMKLGELAQLESGHTPSRARADWWGGDVSWVSLTEIRALDGRWVESTQIKTNEAGIANSSARILPRGPVCFSRTASVGFVTIMAKPMATSQDFANWVCGDALDPEYDSDELQQRIQLQAVTFSAIVTGLITFSYGFLENIGFPHFPSLFIFPLLIALWGIGAGIFARKDK